MEIQVFQKKGEQVDWLGLLKPGVTLTGFAENGCYLFQVSNQNSRLYIDDAPLEMDPLRAYWQWSPGFYAGEVIVELEYPGRSEPVRYLVDVAPAAHKSGREQYLEYISAIADYAPQLLLGTEPARQGLGGRSHVNLATWIRYARLRCFIESYLAAIRAVCERPLYRQCYFRELRPIHLARRIDRGTVRHLESNPALFAAVAGRATVSNDLRLADNRLDVPFNEPTLDHPANRLLAEQLNNILRLVCQLIEQFEQTNAVVSETQTEINARLPRRIKYLRKLQKQLAKFSRLSPFDSVSRQSPGVAGINAVAGSPHYSRSHRLGVRILREGLSELAADEQHYLAPTWQVYESWCFVAIAQQLEETLPEFEWNMDYRAAFADMILTGKKGERRIRLYGQMRCPSLEQENAYGYASISRERRPDMVFEYDDGMQRKFICLDSKYSSSREAILNAMMSAHLYRDSIKLNGYGSVFSFLLVPHCQHVERLASDNYIDKHGVGCLPLSANEEAGEVVGKLTSWLACEAQRNESLISPK